MKKKIHITLMILSVLGIFRYILGLETAESVLDGLWYCIICEVYFGLMVYINVYLPEKKREEKMYER